MIGIGAGFGFGLGDWLWILGWVFLVAGIVAVIAWLATRMAAGARTERPVTAPGSDPLAVLRDPFARGEITHDEFQAARQVLEAER